jgi:succinate dehydrogenase/fumarate reductase-like Fe-S protein
MANLQVNGQARAYDGDPSMPLLWYLRDELAMTGTKFGCGVGLCGACTVHLNGEAVRSCQVQMSDTAGKSVTTIEGLHPKHEHPVQMRLLPDRPDHERGRPAGQEARAHRRRDSQRHGRQSLSLRLLSTHPHGRSRRRKGGVT